MDAMIAPAERVGVTSPGTRVMRSWRLVFPTSLVLSVRLGATIVFACQIATAQQTGCAPPMNWTSEQDHRNMMDQLGVKALRPGPSGNDQAPNHANYDESLANPYNNVPDPLVMN